MTDEDPGKLADQLDQQAGELEKRSGKLSDEIKEVGEDWQRKRGDSSVPGAPPDESGDQPEDADAEETTDAQKDTDAEKDDRA